MSDDESSQLPFIDDCAMGDVIDKLKLLDYETDFCTLVKPPFKPLNKFYFVGASTVDNPNTQFYYFTSLCAWLMNLGGHSFDTPGQFDDPNATTTTILAELRKIGISGASLAPNRIKQGSGEAVMQILLALLNTVLVKKRFNFQPIDYSRMPKYDESEEVADGDAEMEDATEVEDNIVLDSDDDGDMFYRPTSDKDNKDDYPAPVASSINADEWNMEVERVAPLLQVHGATVDDWRSRIESASVLLKAVDKMYPEVKVMLERLGGDMEKSRERIQKREQTLATQFTEQVEEYRVKLRELNSSRDAANAAGQSVQQLTMELNQVSEILDQTKRDIEDREAKISDTTPLMQVKEAVTKVQAEIKQMELRIGVLQNSVLHYVMKQTKARREGAPSDGYDDMLGSAADLYYD